jgi:hypothetical protein
MGRAGRPTVTIELTDEERETLVRWSRRHSSSQALALRSRIVLACADGRPKTKIAAELGCDRSRSASGATGSPRSGRRGWSTHRGLARRARSATRSSRPASLTSQDPQTVRGAYPVMELTGWVVLVPLSLASLLTGLVCSLGSSWGLFRHYWVLFKLVINVVATIVLLLYMQTLDYLAEVAAVATLSSSEPGELRSPSPVLHAGAALLLLVAATTLAIYKPRGMTRYGRRKQHRHRTVLIR